MQTITINVANLDTLARITAAFASAYGCPDSPDETAARLCEHIEAIVTGVEAAAVVTDPTVTPLTGVTPA